METVSSSPEMFEPWVKYPEVTRDRLVTVANIVRDVRNSAAERYDPSAGDGPWSLGCTGYERTCNKLTEAQQNFPWLTVNRINGNPLCLCFCIGLVPFRFYRGEADDPPQKYRSVTYPELASRQLALDFGVAIPPDGTLRLAVETDALGRATTISVVELDETGDPIRRFIVPDERAGNVLPLRPRPIETPAPVIEPVLDEEFEGGQDAVTG